LDSPANLLTYGYIDPQAHGVGDKLQRIRTALEARRIDRADKHIRQFLEECDP
jgi:hypothetical protein